VVAVAAFLGRARPERASVIRLVDRFPRSLSAEPGGAAPRLVAAFDFDGGTEGWAAAGTDSRVDSGGGRLLVDVTPTTLAERAGAAKVPPIVARDVDFDARDVNAISLRLRVPASRSVARLFWTRAGESEFGIDRSASFAAPADGEDHDCRIVLAGEPRWSGRISRIGLFLTNFATRVEIDRVALLKLPLAERLRLSEPGGAQAKIRVGGETIEAVLVAPGEEKSIEVDPPPGAALEAWVGGVGETSPAGAEDAPTIEIRIEASGRFESYTQSVFPGDASRPRLLPLRIEPVSRTRGPVRITFRAFGGAGADWMAAIGAPVVVAGRVPGPNLVVVSLDTLRAGHVRSYGHARETTPNLDRLAAAGALFTDATSPAPYTLAAHMSLMTSLWPSFHGVLDNDDRLSDDLPTLAEAMRGAGLRTAAVVEDGYVAAPFGFHRGFERYDEGEERIEIDPSRARKTFERATSALERLKDQRFFLFVHTYAIHTPYNAPEPYASLFDPDYAGPVAPGFDQDDGRRAAAGLVELGDADVRHVKALYDGGIRAADDALGRFLLGLARLGLERDTLVIALSDHGEEFFDHDLSIATHGYATYREQEHVPLVARWPGTIARGEVIDEPVSLVDVFPTVLSLFGLPRGAASFQGEDLASLLLSGRPPPPRAVFSQELRFTRQTAVRAGSLKLIRTEGPEEAVRRVIEKEFPRLARRLGVEGVRRELYDVSLDPLENNDLASVRAAEADALENLVLDLLAGAAEFRKGRTGAARAGTIDPELEKRLEGLGYFGKPR